MRSKSLLRRVFVLIVAAGACIGLLLLLDRDAPHVASDVAAPAKLTVQVPSLLLERKRQSAVRIVASLSTFPGRMEQVRLCLQSLFRQTLPLDAVYVHIPFKIRRLNVSIDEVALASELAELQAAFGPKLLVRRGEDYGPATKLIGTLKFEAEPSTLVVTVDDDVEYDPRMVQALFSGYLEHPDNFIANACEEPTDINEPAWTYIYENRVCKGWACAFKGTLYRVGMFDKSIFDYSGVPPGCVVHDDVFLSGYLFRRGFRPFKIDVDFDSVVQHHWRPKFTVGGTEDIKYHQIECVRYFGVFAD
ncbi:hypothetical protein HK105_204032 [Polyrhizophydium stewartii]|uniref:Hexosyltransferase n=1 Tax=Polyrhizophydium stewartii TaxID=2732419 RepID=A0ABR4N9Z3_9FUNG|nr:hypothetical protein HK105_008050 [Polyrhizophydium stewartii]